MLIQALNILTFVVTVLMLIVVTRFTKRLPTFVNEVLTDVGEGLTNDLSEMIEKPNVKRAFSILSNKSHEARADKATRKKAAEGIMSQIPMAKMVLDQMGLSAEEGLQLYNDPILGPTIRGFIEKAMQNIGKGETTPQRSNTTTQQEGSFTIG